MITEVKQGDGCTLIVALRMPGSNAIADMRYLKRLSAIILTPAGDKRSVVCSYDETINKVIVPIVSALIAANGIYAMQIKAADKDDRIITTAMTNVIAVGDAVVSSKNNIHLQFDVSTNYEDTPDEGGLTEGQREWIGEGAAIANGATSLPEGINNNSTAIDNLDKDKAPKEHDHNALYAPKKHDHNEYIIGVKINGSLKKPVGGIVDLGTVGAGDGSIPGTGSGLTEEQAAWLGSGVNLNNGSTSLPEGINKNSDDIEVLSDGVNDNSRAIVAINEVLSARFPFKILSFTGGKIAEKGTTVSVALAWSYDGIPTSQALTQNGASVSVALSDRSKNIASITANTTFVLTANGVTASQAISFYNCRYVGVVDAAPTTEAGVKSLTKLSVSSGKGYSWTGDLSNQSVCYCYPKSFGMLTTIKDANGFDYLAGYTRTEVTVNGEAYYVYTSGKSISTNFKQIFA